MLCDDNSQKRGDWCAFFLVIVNKTLFFPIAECSAVTGPLPSILFAFFSSCPRSLSIQVWHLLSAEAGSISVCTLSAGWAWLGEILLQTLITWTVGSELQMKEMQRDTLGVWDQSVFFIGLGYHPGSFFCPRFILFFFSVWYVTLFFCSVSLVLSHILPSSVPPSSLYVAVCSDPPSLTLFFKALLSSRYLFSLANTLQCNNFHSSHSFFNPQISCDFHVPPPLLPRILFFFLPTIPCPALPTSTRQSITSLSFLSLSSFPQSLYVPCAPVERKASQRR